MKVTFTILALFTILFSGCRNTRYITEQLIKNRIEQHQEGEFSTIRTYSIFNGMTYQGDAYLELTGYKYKNRKALVIGADKYYMARKKFPGDQTKIADITYTELTLPQCQAIIDNYRIIQERIINEKPKLNEEIYHDYSVSEDLFISYRKAKGYSNYHLDFWIQGEKYSLSTNTIIQKLEKFIKY